MEHTFQLQNKLVAVMNKSIEIGKVLNALAHMSMGLGAQLGKKELALIDYRDKSGNVYPNISKMPFIILRASGGQIKKLRLEAIEKNICSVTFTDTMSVGSWNDQLELTSKTEESNLNCSGIVLYGLREDITMLTKKFSLWK